uniref:Uncharacterized protein n=1 Tax=Zooxanthella nutricula TaxID=1333877 RepID=A0A7S2NGP2_9DINO
MPTCALLSGGVLVSQPMLGDRMADWRDRAAPELGLPPSQIALLAGAAPIPLHADLHEYRAVSLQVLILPPPAPNQAHRVEAVLWLLSTCGRVIHDDGDAGSSLVSGLLARLEGLQGQLPKRLQFDLSDVLQARRAWVCGLTVCGRNVSQINRGAPRLGIEEAGPSQSARVRHAPSSDG